MCSNNHDPWVIATNNSFQGKYLIKNFKLDSKKLPPYLPASTYKAIVNIYDFVGSKQIFVANVSVNIIVDNSNQIKRLSFMGLKL